MNPSHVLMSVILFAIISISFSFNEDKFFANAIISDGTVSDSVKFSDALGDLFRNLNLNPGDSFGFPLKEIGDLNDDGIEDVAVGVPLADDIEQDSGAVYILFMDTDGSAKDVQKISNSRGNLTQILEKKDNFGSSIAVLEDLDGDGNIEIVVGAPGTDKDSKNKDTGAVYILFLNNDGRVKSEIKIAEGSGGFDIKLEKNEKFGFTVRNIGDLDGGGIDDIAVGSPEYSKEEKKAGAVYVLLLNADGTVDDATRIDGTEDPFDDNGWELDKDDLFGFDIELIGDVDGGGVNDILVGAPRVNDDKDKSGAIFVVFLNNDGTLDDVQRISNSDGNLGYNLGKDDNFGLIIEVLEDYDSNGISEFAAGVPRDDDEKKNAGAMYIINLGSDGKVDDSVKITEGSGGFTGDLDEDYLFGFSIASIGDLDGDGNDDIAVGSPGDDTIDNESGAVYVLFMNPDGTVDTFQKITQGEGGFTGVLDEQDAFGSAINLLGDLNNDGENDIAIGLPGDDTADVNAGSIYNLLLDTDGTVKTTQKITEGIGVNEISLNPHDEGGTGVSAIGDLNGDSFDDFVFGIPKNDGSEDDIGGLYVVFANSDKEIISRNKITEGVGDFTAPLDAGDKFGTSVSFFQDLDGDGIEDMIVGAPGDSDVGDDTGAAYVLFMGDDGKVDGYQKITEGVGGFFEDLSDKDEFGYDVATIGDLDGDGIEDVVVGAPKDEADDKHEGAIYILFMNDDGTVKNSQKITEGEGGFTGILGHDHFGHSVGLIGDLDDDGVADIAVGAIKDSAVEKDAGAVYILFMNIDGTVDHHKKITGNDLDGYILDEKDEFGSFVSPVSDLDGDGIEDLLVGIAKDDTAGKDTGAIMTLFLDTTGDVLGFQKVTEGQGGFDQPLNQEDKFGTSGAIIDFNNDNIPDYLIGTPFDDDGGTDSGALYVLLLNGQEGVEISMTDVILKSFENLIEGTISQTIKIITANLNSHEEAMSMMDIVLKTFSKTVDESMLIGSEGFNNGSNKLLGEGVSLSQLVLKIFEKPPSESLALDFKAISSKGSPTVEIDEIFMDESISILKHPENFAPIFGGPPGVISEIICQVTSAPSNSITEDDGDSISFLADSVADCTFEANPCSRGCTIYLEDITTEQLSLSGIENPLDAIFYEDPNEDGVFEELQTFVITEDPYSYLGITFASGTDFGLGESFPQTSETPVVRGGGGGGGGDKTAPSYNTAPVAGEYPLVINGRSIDLSEFTTYLGQPIIAETGKAVKIKLRLYDNSGPQNIQHVSMYTDIRGMTHSVQKSNTFFIFENNEISGIGNKDSLLSDVKATSKIVDSRLELDFEVTFKEPMDTSNTIIRVWDKQRNSMDRHVMNSIKIIPSIEKMEGGVSDGFSLHTIADWSDFSSKSVEDKELLSGMGIKEYSIPNWTKNLGNYLLEKQISYKEFFNALEYLSKNIQGKDESVGVNYSVTVKESVGVKSKP